MTDIERMEFLTAYEDLGPGGLTDAEQIELAALRVKLKPLSEIDYSGMSCIYSLEDLNYYTQKISDFTASISNRGTITNTGTVVWNTAAIVGQP